MNTNLSISDASILRQKAEEKMKLAKSKKKKSITELDMLKLIHELEVHQIELELVNEEQRLANLHTSEANQKYTDLYDFAPTGYFTLSSQGRILKINHHGAQMLGKTRPKLINSLLGSFVQADSKIYLITFLKEIFQKKNIKPVCDITILSNEKNICHVRLTGTISEDQEQCYVTATDITELKNAEDELRKNLAKYKVLIDTFPIAITISDPEGNIIESNEKATELLGIAREEHLRRKIMGREWKIIKTDGAVFPPEEFPSVKS